MLGKQDILQIERHGLTVQAVERQIEAFKTGFPYLKIVGCAHAGDGILTVSPDEADSYRSEYRNACNTMKVEKFVPASGAATRMFKDLFSFIESGMENATSRTVVENISDFAFADELGRYVDFSSDTPRRIVSAVLGDGLGYGSKPKGLILFHNYPSGNRTAFEEHLCESAMYADCNGEVNIHFTVSPEHVNGFQTLYEQVRRHYENKYDVHYNISMSVQKSGTDTIAVDTDCNPFRTDDGRLLFRPAGHGALIENLNDIDADLIFIKNVDNVAPDRLKADTIKYKEILAGLLLSLQRRIFGFMHQIDADEGSAEQIARFVENELCVKMPAEWKHLPDEQLCRKLRTILNRPTRVCGMVRNEGEPGGGPFWAENADSSISLQIAEPSQIAPAQKEIMAQSTHFNPVDLVCATKDYNGVKFDLHDYIDKSTGFISQKSYSGRDLLAQELPGLWNGAMARWNTVFVEVPVSTFSPVKVVTDLLREQHR